ncbi:MAG TPA: YhbY family RNA-binding protein [Candidatus Enteromonas pullicola]|uniref:YhbY family RNA-binding protein n=1 Tax=Candidatus Alloenteromonas pullicola TaxID=2840784 RepID=A0A9D1LPD0_9FIRM|nr:YhbY family RNA-binding protein [Candidatus Enteromonas pullicola]
MLKGKQLSYLRGLANTIDHRYLLGKQEPDEAFLDQLDKALEANELIKVGILQNSESKPRELGEDICAKLGAELVQIIGRVIVLYRPSNKHRKIVLPA